jgi:ferric-dicitrate binding protein FerR (iron transport regulator)
MTDQKEYKRQFLEQTLGNDADRPRMGYDELADQVYYKNASPKLDARFAAALKSVEAQDAAVLRLERDYRFIRGIAASLAFLVAFCAVAAALWYRTQASILETGTAQTTHFTDDIGNSVWMKSGSQVRYINTNQAFLQFGETFWVANKAEGIEVVTEKFRVVIFGDASVNVMHRGDYSRVTVLHGSALVVTNTGVSKTLASLEEFSLRGAASRTRQVSQAYFENHWKDNKLYYEEETLEFIFSDLERVFSISIVSPDGLRKQVFSGIVPSNTPQEALAAILPLPYNARQTNPGEYTVGFVTRELL